MLVNFLKMHALGNHFVVIDQITQNVQLRAEHIRRIADRCIGIGCDQVILIEPPIGRNADFFYRIYNADGQEVEQCGNGARCAARFFFDSGYSNRQQLYADCVAGPVECKIGNEGWVTVNMGQPCFHPEAIPLDMVEPAIQYPVVIEESVFNFSSVSMGNPHAILQVSALDQAPVQQIGALLSIHPLFPKGTNVGFMEIVDTSKIRLRVFERGVGETLSCGTGACAAVVSGIELGILKSPVTVLFLKGSLNVRWQGKDTPVYLSGPTASVFMGRFRL